ncbi:tRNA preQ1(34) S-adenosylmethionine ribosyltransferase-isomerase QueA [Helicobacter pametensis]|uniref:tRNA preQ1(34) S-adenosylmethionine ribosyltransferase-isomerase QueA n=1 Tax=Helicobacter pametensis TaxID=95149 RepID=UPI0004B0220A
MIGDHLLANYDYHLPQELIATHPASPRESAKLLIYDRKSDQITHSDFWHFFDFIAPDTLFVLNNTKVIKARLFGHKIHQGQKGGEVEVFYHKHLNQNLYLVQIRGRVKEGTEIVLSPSFSLKVCKLLDSGFREVEFLLHGKYASLQDVLHQVNLLGHTPLPPYIKREDTKIDEADYQSVFAQQLGAVAAPTASLHFSDISYLQSHFDHCFVTLHVGAGTFLGVETQDIRDHQIHTESFSITQESWQKIQKSKNILCIGTTSARVVEYLNANPPLFEGEILSGECNIFLHPLNPPSKLNALLTNFHLPKSTLIMLVSSLVGREKCLELYHQAIKHGYRFYSYGDGMLIL